ncbi:hypothetical protein JHK82_052796 [Glycine max]|uniref:COBRA-like protein 8 n=1 Tax=Glycine soja TaxID=3848 RepID=A0A0B2Q4U9_GLYSO|nr:hypothetical protein JHK86_052649 [Glycine max]KAG4927015.1 hypothetical protein JHK85_053501 [Glycine max]KAG5082640.1 hypothetical protein JHK84_052678 [Glycine max]KAG5085399.1 hypothetical protein JHK82_052796 [Glycine max]KHN16265.1 COBRA-like protein 8 [Glycine soja]
MTMLNNGLDELKSWEAFVGFDHDELLVSASNVVLPNGTTLPPPSEKASSSPTSP